MLEEAQVNKILCNKIAIKKLLHLKRFESIEAYKLQPRSQHFTETHSQETELLDSS